MKALRFEETAGVPGTEIIAGFYHGGEVVSRPAFEASAATPQIGGLRFCIHGGPRDNAAMADEAQRPPRGPLDVAAIDLGSNSFHMVLAQESDGQLRVLDRLKERVALAEGLSLAGTITEAAKERARDCLARFSQRLQGFDPALVRAVGTNTFRAADDAESFLEECSELLGHPIEIVSGPEEARLTYAGVRFDSGLFGRHLCVVDIGGGSTEIATGRGENAKRAESLAMGHVVWTERFFADGQITKQRFAEARQAARLVMRSVVRAIRRQNAEVYVGSSGTALAIAAIIAANGWESSPEVAGMAGHFSIEGLHKLRDALLEAGSIDAIKLKGLPDNRRPVIIGGVAIMVAVFDALRFERMIVSNGALREGLLSETVGRLHQRDRRDAVVLAMAKRFSVDMEQAGRVASTAALLFEVVRREWGLKRSQEGLILRWGALLHEIGLSVNHDSYRRHSMYLVGNADLPGFTRNAQERLAALVGAHRGSFDPAAFEDLRPELARGLVGAALLLRVARILHRSRSSRPLPPWKPKAKGGEGADGQLVRYLDLNIPKNWADEHPLTRAELEAEATDWARTGSTLKVVRG